MSAPAIHAELGAPFRLVAGLCLALTLALGHAGCGRHEADGTDAAPRPGSAVDLSGREIDPAQVRDAKAVVCLFLSTECPISNRYAPEIERLRAKFAPRGAAFWLVYPNADESNAAVQRHAREYRLGAAVLRDPRHALVKRAQARITPEAAVFAPGGRLAYHGRIDNRHVALGQTRPEATQHDLEEALQAVLEGKAPAAASAPAVGCSIATLK